MRINTQNHFHQFPEIETTMIFGKSNKSAIIKALKSKKCLPDSILLLEEGEIILRDFSYFQKILEIDYLTPFDNPGGMEYALYKPINVTEDNKKGSMLMWYFYYLFFKLMTNEEKIIKANISNTSAWHKIKNDHKEILESLASTRIMSDFFTQMVIKKIKIEKAEISQI